MWFERYKIEAIEQALKGGQKTGLLSILPQENGVENKPLALCPKCGKALIPKKLNLLSVVIQACPDEHGYCLSEENIRSIRHLLKGDGVVSQRIVMKRSSFQVFVVLIGMALIAFNAIQKWLGHNSSSNRKMSLSMKHDAKVSPLNWPGRDFSQWNILPDGQEIIVDPQELSYFQRWMVITNEGIVNRLNMHDALLAKRPADEYLNTYNFFANRQRMVVLELNTLAPPQRLEVFHDYVTSAISSQIDFYDDFVRQKVENPSVDLSQLLGHPKLMDCDKKLWAAFYEFARIYPQRDASTNNAIEQRLCWLDMI